MSITKFAFYCRCGDSMVGAVGPESPDELERIFRRLHSEGIHGPASKDEARKERRRRERQREGNPS